MIKVKNKPKIEEMVIFLKMFKTSMGEPLTMANIKVKKIAFAILECSRL